LQSTLTTIYDVLLDARSRNTTIICPESIHAPAATIQTFTSGATTVKMPDRNTWLKAYQNDAQCKLMLDMKSKPSLIKKINLDKLHYVYRQPMRSSNILSKTAC
jgi:hypothetical protein